MHDSVSQEAQNKQKSEDRDNCIKIEDQGQPTPLYCHLYLVYTLNTVVFDL